MPQYWQSMECMCCSLTALHTWFSWQPASTQNYVCRSLWWRATPFLAEPRMPGCKMAFTLKAAHPSIAAWLPGRTHTLGTPLLVWNCSFLTLQESQLQQQYGKHLWSAQQGPWSKPDCTRPSGN